MKMKIKNYDIKYLAFILAGFGILFTILLGGITYSLTMTYKADKITATEFLMVLGGLAIPFGFPIVLCIVGATYCYFDSLNQRIKRLEAKKVEA